MRRNPISEVGPVLLAALILAGRTFCLVRRSFRYLVALVMCKPPKQEARTLPLVPRVPRPYEDYRSYW